MMAEILDVRDLKVYYHTSAGPVKAADGVSFALKKGERLGLVGESGSGKSTVVLALMRLVPPPGRIEEGEALLDGMDLFELSDEQLRQARGAQISIIPQGAMNSLNPVMRIKYQMMDTITAHEGRKSTRELMPRVYELLEWVELWRDVAEMYPHELSGGMKQRVGIAMAISLRPKVIIADEPTSALDVVVQKQVMETLGQVQESIGASVILVGHDMGLQAQFADKVGIMYAGRLMEVGPVEDIFANPLHPYTRLLIATLPSLDSRGVFKGIPGMPPSLLTPPPGCAFHPRCPECADCCKEELYSLKEVRPGHWVACQLVNGGRS
jgi:oligopeptide/dipeptide ABC transporter ATP-binding protein